MTSRLLPDDIAIFADHEFAADYERAFRRANDHIDCQVCHGSNWASRAFVFPRNGFGEFPLDFRHGVAVVVQSV